VKKNVTIRAFSLVVASVVLSGAVVFAAVTGSPYEILKKATLDAMTYHNVTMEGQMTLTINGIIEEELKFRCVAGENACLEYDSDENGDISSDKYSYAGRGLNIRPLYVAEDGFPWYRADIWPGEFVPNSRYFVIDAQERHAAAMRFLELAIDALVGDLKNNVTMSSENEIRVIRGTLAERQVPELLKAGLDLLAEEVAAPLYKTKKVSFDGKEYVYEDTCIAKKTKTVTTYKVIVSRPLTSEEDAALKNAGMIDLNVTWIDDAYYVVETPERRVSEDTAPATRADYDDVEPLNRPMQSLAVDYVHWEGEIDANGNMLTMDIGGIIKATDILGDINVCEIKFTVDFSDIGTSRPVCPIPGAEQLLTPVYAKTHFGNEYMTVFFTLNQDGSINTDSITKDPGRG